MTVSLMQKDKGTVVAQAKSDLDVKVERLIELKVQIDAIKAQVDEYEKLRKELSGLSDTIGAANEQVTFEVENGVVSFSAKTFERKVTDMPKVFAHLGQDNFLKVASVALKDIDKYLNVNEQTDCVTKDLTGARKISVSPKSKTVTQE